MKVWQRKMLQVGGKRIPVWSAMRIPLSWNISTGKIAGSPLPEVEAQREKLAAEK